MLTCYSAPYLFYVLMNVFRSDIYAICTMDMANIEVGHKSVEWNVALSSPGRLCHDQRMLMHARSCYLSPNSLRYMWRHCHNCSTFCQLIFASPILAHNLPWMHLNGKLIQQECWIIWGCALWIYSLCVCHVCMWWSLLWNCNGILSDLNQ